MQQPVTIEFWYFVRSDFESCGWFQAEGKQAETNYKFWNYTRIRNRLLHFFHDGNIQIGLFVLGTLVFSLKDFSTSAADFLRFLVEVSCIESQKLWKLSCRISILFEFDTSVAKPLWTKHLEPSSRTFV